MQPAEPARPLFSNAFLVHAQGQHRGECLQGGRARQPQEHVGGGAPRRAGAVEPPVGGLPGAVRDHELQRQLAPLLGRPVQPHLHGAREVHPRVHGERGLAEIHTAQKEKGRKFVYAIF